MKPLTKKDISTGADVPNMDSRFYYENSVLGAKQYAKKKLRHFLKNTINLNEEIVKEAEKVILDEAFDIEDKET